MDNSSCMEIVKGGLQSILSSIATFDPWCLPSAASVSFLSQIRPVLAPPKAGASRYLRPVASATMQGAEAAALLLALANTALQVCPVRPEQCLSFFLLHHVWEEHI